MTVTASGQLKHHFWGEYSATIGLKFARYADASTVYARYLTGANGWQLFGFENDPAGYLKFHGKGEAEKRAESDLIAAGADPNKIGSLRFSVDYGEPFTASFDVTPEPTETQIDLFA